MTIDAADRLVKVEWVSTGAYEAEADIRVICTDRNTRMTPTALLPSGYCNCECEQDE